MEWLDRLGAKIGAKKGIVGIELVPDGLAFAAKGCQANDEQVDTLELISTSTELSELQTELSHQVQKFKLTKRLCHLVLNPRDYQLLLVEAPDVPDEDLREAVRWRIKDLVAMPVEQAVIDVFHLPADANRGAKKMIYVVVAPLERMQALIELVNESGLTLSSIDIGEMAMRNLSLVISGDDLERSVGITRVFEKGGVVSLYKGGNLYLSRQFQLDYNGGLLDDLPADALALELQRSLDYYERQMGMSPPAAMYICGENVSEDKVTLELKRSINVPAQFLDIAQNVQFNEEIDEGMMQACIGALGAAYREVSLR